MAVLTDHESLASPLDHDCHPFGRCLLVPLDEIGEFANLVNLHRLRAPAYLTTAHKESGDQLLVTDRLADQLAFCMGLFTVDQDRILLPSQRNTPEPCDQWLFTFAARHADLEASARPFGSLDGRRIFAGHLRHRRVVLAGQRLEH